MLLVNAYVWNKKWVNNFSKLQWLVLVEQKQMFSPYDFGLGDHCAFGVTVSHIMVTSLLKYCSLPSTIFKTIQQE